MSQTSASLRTRETRRSRRSKPFDGSPHNLALSAGVLVLSALAGVLYSRSFGNGDWGVGAVYGLAIGSLVHAFERGWFLGRLQARIRALPTLVHVPLAEVAYIGIIALGTAVAGAICWPLGLVREGFWDAMLPTATVLLYSLAVSAIIVFVTRMRDLLGTGVFANLLLGRYYRPVQEPRIFLFIDLQGSTAYAERYGDLRAQEYLAAIFAALAEPVRRSHGAIDDYVGDMAMVTWPLAKGAKNARCVSCVIDFLAEIEKDAALWRQRFGEVPRFRAALHGGAVVTAEIGVDRHKISHFGDVLNTTGRMEALCRTLDTPILISSDLLDNLPPLPDGVQARSLGEHALKGRGQRLSVFALDSLAASTGA